MISYLYKRQKFCPSLRHCWFFFSCDQLANIMEAMRTISYHHLDWLEIQLLQWTCVSPSWWAKEAHGIGSLFVETQPSASPSDPKIGEPGDVAHATISFDANLAAPLVHGHAKNSCNAIQRRSWLLAWNGCMPWYWPDFQIKTPWNSNPHWWQTGPKSTSQGDHVGGYALFTVIWTTSVAPNLRHHINSKSIRSRFHTKASNIIDRDAAHGPNSITLAGYSIADACAHDQMAQIIGFLNLPQHTVWFSERFTPTDSYQLEVEVNTNMQRDIACCKTLAQLTIVKLLAQGMPAQRYSLRISSLSDNTGAAAGVNTLFTTKLLMTLFLEKLCVTATTTGIQLDVSHISGKSNELADAISRWNFNEDPPPGVELAHRIRFNLSDLWLGCPRSSIFPSHTSRSWSLPSWCLYFNLLNEHTCCWGFIHIFCCMFIQMTCFPHIVIVGGFEKFHVR